MFESWFANIIYLCLFVFCLYLSNLYLDMRLKHIILMKIYNRKFSTIIGRPYKFNHGLIFLEIIKIFWRIVKISSTFSLVLRRQNLSSSALLLSNIKILVLLRFSYLLIFVLLKKSVYFNWFTRPNLLICLYP